MPRARMCIATVLMAAFAGLAAAQAPYPSRPVRVVLPFLAGGSLDVIARAVADHASPRMGQPWIIDNRAGAGGTIGAELVAKAAPDGYTLLFTPQGPLVINPFLMKQLPYNAMTAFAPISVVVEAPNVLTIPPSLPFRTVPDFIAYAKSNPGKMTFASQGIGTTGHITGGMITSQMGIALTHVPYKGFPPMLADVMTGRVGMMLADTLNVLPRIRNKELVAVAVAAATRSPMLPDVPTFAEHGYPGVVAGPWFAVLGPAGTPLDIRRKLSLEILAIMKIASVRERFDGLGVEIRATTPEDFEVFLKSEYRRWGDAIRAAGITPE